MRSLPPCQKDYVVTHFVTTFSDPKKERSQTGHQHGVGFWLRHSGDGEAAIQAGTGFSQNVGAEA